jgi:hypothetical protein
MPVVLQRFLCSELIITRGLSLDVSLGGMSAVFCGVPLVDEAVIIELPLAQRGY